MLKKLVLIALVLAALLVTASPAFAASGYYYVDTSYTGTEVGTATQPYNTVAEAVSAAQSNPYGGYIYTRASASASYTYYGFIRAVNPPGTGAPLSTTALFILLGIASLILVVTGRFLMRRSRTLPNRA